jgi:hypothetical protein
MTSVYIFKNGAVSSILVQNFFFGIIFYGYLYYLPLYCKLTMYLTAWAHAAQIKTFENSQ